MKVKKQVIPVIIFLLLTGVCLLYLFVFRSMVSDLYFGEGPEWLHNLLLKVYPRFDVEKHRFNLLFFIDKADQVVIRSTVAILVAQFFYVAFNNVHRFHDKVINFWNSHIPVKRVQWLRVIMGMLFIYFSWEILWDMQKLLPIKAFYNPIPVYKLLHIPFPSTTGIVILYSLLILASVTLILNRFPVISSIVTISIFVLIQGYYFSFEKTDHGYATFIYAGMIFPFLLYEYKKAKIIKSDTQKGWPLQLILVAISLVYLLSGLEKLSISGINWVNADTFKTYLLLHEAPLGIAISNIDWLCVLLPACALLFQLSFFLNVVLMKYRWLFLVSGILFHLGTVALFDISSYINPWILVYALFIDWEKLGYWLFNKLSFRFIK